MGMEPIIAAAAATVYLIGGALLLFIVGAYKKTGNFNLIVLALGLFMLVFGSNLGVFYWIFFKSLYNLDAFQSLETGYLISLVFQIPGIILIFYSAVRR